MRRTLLLLISVALLFAGTHSWAQEHATSTRKVVNRVVPVYPAMARGLGLKGIARLNVLVLPNGNVKTVKVSGGHPVLAQAAANAVSSWRWEPSQNESWENVEVTFTSN